MVKNKKNAVAKTKRVMLGENAQSFYDASTGIFLGRGETKELTVRQYSSPKIKKAITNGHLVLVIGDIPELTDENKEDLKAKFDTLVNQGMTATKISKAFSMEQIQAVAEQYGLTPEEGDTVKSIIEDILSEIEGTVAKTEE